MWVMTATFGAILHYFDLELEDPGRSGRRFDMRTQRRRASTRSSRVDVEASPL
jgi:hypothetical protein